jgi:hypothetical protein
LEAAELAGKLFPGGVGDGTQPGGLGEFLARLGFLCHCVLPPCVEITSLASKPLANIL